MRSRGIVACVAKQIDLPLELVGEMQADEAESAAKLGEELEIWRRMKSRRCVRQ